MDGVHLTTVQVIPGAVGGACGAHVDMAILSNCEGYVGICSIATGPADRAKIVLAVGETLHVFRYAGACFEFFRQTHCAVTLAVMSSDSEGKQLSTGQFDFYHCLVGLKRCEISEVSRGYYCVD